MGFYGNKWLTENAQTDRVEMELFTIESVVYDEYCNYKQLLENASGYDAILEAKVEVLYEISITDIKNKIKELWQRFKDFIKKIWNILFDKNKISKKRNEKAIKDAKDTVQKAKAEGVKLESVLFEREEDYAELGKFNTVSYYYYDKNKIKDSDSANKSNAVIPAGELSKFIQSYDIDILSIASKFENIVDKVYTGNKDISEAKSDIDELMQLTDEKGAINDFKKQMDSLVIYGIKNDEPLATEKAMDYWYSVSALLTKDTDVALKYMNKAADEKDKFKLIEKMNSDKLEYFEILQKVSVQITNMYYNYIKVFGAIIDKLINSRDQVSIQLNKISAKIRSQLNA